MISPGESTKVVSAEQTWRESVCVFVQQKASKNLGKTNTFN